MRQEGLYPCTWPNHANLPRCLGVAFGAVARLARTSGASIRIGCLHVEDCSSLLMQCLKSQRNQCQSPLPCDPGSALMPNPTTCPTAAVSRFGYVQVCSRTFFCVNSVLSWDHVPISSNALWCLSFGYWDFFGFNLHTETETKRHRVVHLASSWQCKESMAMVRVASSCRGS